MVENMLREEKKSNTAQAAEEREAINYYLT